MITYILASTNHLNNIAISDDTQNLRCFLHQLSSCIALSLSRLIVSSSFFRFAANLLGLHLLSFQLAFCLGLLGLRVWFLLFQPQVWSPKKDSLHPLVLKALKGHAKARLVWIQKKNARQNMKHESPLSCPFIYIKRLLDLKPESQTKLNTSISQISTCLLLQNPQSPSARVLTTLLNSRQHD